VLHPVRPRLRRALLTAASAACAVAPTLSAQAPTRARVVATVDSLATAFLADGPVAAVSIAVVKGRDTILMRGYGLADVENDVPASAKTVYRIGSITKQFTAAAIMRLVENGKLSLDDTLGKLGWGAPSSWQSVTVRRLLNHTSGIRSYTSIGPRWQRRWREDMLPDTIVGLVRDDTLDFKPGAQWRYNNTGYVLLGMIVQGLSKKPYETFLEEEFFRPLELSQTYYCSQKPLIKHRAQGYQRVSRQLVNAEYLSMTQPFSAGALVAWQRALVGGRVVRPASYATMTTPESLSDGKPLTYGYGLGVGTFEKRRRISHGGGINGFSTELAYYPDDTLHVVVLANTESNPARLADQIARAALGLPLPTPPRGVALAGAERARYVGAYTLTIPSGPKAPIRVFEQADTLMAQIAGQMTGRLIALGNHAFVLRENPEVRFTFTVDGGRATRLTLAQPGATLEATRDP
jgi:D-alanyl-D-alanine carboxypeptidase